MKSVRTMMLALVIVLLWGTLPCMNATADTVVVRVNAQNTTGPWDGASWTTAFRDIQTAADTASLNGGGEVWVAAGTYVSTNNPVVAMRTGVSLYGGFAGTETSLNQQDCSTYSSIIDGEDTRKCVVGSDLAVLDGFTVTRGHGANSLGGGMCNEAASPTVTHCTFTGNVARCGGGMSNSAASPTVTHCTFTGNSASFYGGGMYNAQGSSPTVTHCVFIGDSVTGGFGFGGGMCNESSSPTVANCAFMGNSAGGYGLGGGMYNEACSLTVTNCTFTANSASGAYGFGGGICSLFSSLAVTNSTFTANSASGANGCGGGMCNYGTSPTLTNCILWGDVAFSGAEIYNFDGSSAPLVIYSCIQGGYAGTGNISEAPLFLDAGGACLQLRTGSPCIDTGTTTGAPATDIRGVARPQGAGIDMGACEGSVEPGDIVTLTVQVSPDGYGTTQPSEGVHSVVRGEVLPLFATASTGRLFAGWSGDISSGYPTAQIVTDGNKTVTANFSARMCTLTYTAGEHGTIRGESPQTVAYGSSGTAVEAVADSGYRFVQWSDDPAQNPRTDVDVAGDIAVTARFAVVHTLTYTAGEHGSISGTAIQTVLAGNNGTPVTAMADIGWRFVQWSDGLTNPFRQDSNASADLSVTAEFAEGATVYRVDARNTAGPWNGATWATAFQNIQPAVDAASALGGEIWVAAGTYTYPTSPVVAMRPGVSLYGGFTGTERLGNLRDWSANATVIDGEGAHQCVAGSNAALLDGFTLTRGYTNDAGGGMSNYASSPMVTNCVFTGNAAGGKGIGGGMYNSSSFPMVTNCVFTGNSADAGGGMFNESSSPPVTNCAFADNSAEDRAGGMDNENASSPAVTNCTFTGNLAGQNGGGMYNESCASLTLTNCLFTANAADRMGGGGGMCNLSSSPTLINCTFTDNSTNDPVSWGGGILYWHGSLTLTNCIFWGNTAPAWPEICDYAVFAGDTPSPLFVTYSCVNGGRAGAGNISADPLFVDAAGGDLRLRPGSPCIDTGTAAGAPATDLLGMARPRGAGVDMGAYETVPDTTAPVITLLGESQLTMECGDPYTDPGAMAADDVSTGLVVTAGGDAVNAGTPGAYTVRYNVSDGSGNHAAEVTRVVTVSDTTAPVIALTGPASVTVECGSGYTDAGATASDACAGSLPVTASGTVNTAAAGAYTLYYHANDGYSAADEVTRTVNVVALPVTVTVNQAPGQLDPAPTPSVPYPVKFAVQFSTAVSGFTMDKVSWAGSTATGITANILAGTGGAYILRVTSCGTGTLVASIPAGAVVDGNGNGNTASASTDNSVTVADGSPSITVTAPTAGAYWARGTTHDITWTGAFLAGSATIQLWDYNGNNIVGHPLYNPNYGTYIELAGSAAADAGAWPWTVPLGLANGINYKVRVLATHSQGSPAAFSSGFEIGGDAPLLRVSSQNTGTPVFAPGHDVTVDWWSHGMTGDVQVMLYDYTGTAASTTLVTGIPAANGTWTWTIPASQTPGGMYKLRVVQTRPAVVGDFNDVYFAIGSGTPFVRMTMPDGGEVWHRSNTHAVTFTTNCIADRVIVQVWNYTTGVCTTLTPTMAPAGVAPAHNGSNTMSWAIPSGFAVGSKFKARVVTRNGARTDFSNSYFTID